MSVSQRMATASHQRVAAGSQYKDRVVTHRYPNGSTVDEQVIDIALTYL